MTTVKVFGVWRKNFPTHTRLTQKSSVCFFFFLFFVIVMQLAPTVSSAAPLALVATIDRPQVIQARILYVEYRQKALVSPALYAQWTAKPEKNKEDQDEKKSKDVDTDDGEESDEKEGKAAPVANVGGKKSKKQKRRAAKQAAEAAAAASIKPQADTKPVAVIAVEPKTKVQVGDVTYEVVPNTLFETDALLVLHGEQCVMSKDKQTLRFHLGKPLPELLCMQLEVMSAPQYTVAKFDILTYLASKKALEHFATRPLVTGQLLSVTLPSFVESVVETRSRTYGFRIAQLKDLAGAIVDRGQLTNRLVFLELVRNKDEVKSLPPKFDLVAHRTATMLAADAMLFVRTELLAEHYHGTPLPIVPVEEIKKAVRNKLPAMFEIGTQITCMAAGIPVRVTVEDVSHDGKVPGMLFSQRATYGFQTKVKLVAGSDTGLTLSDGVTTAVKRIHVKVHSGRPGVYDRSDMDVAVRQLLSDKCLYAGKRFRVYLGEHAFECELVRPGSDAPRDCKDLDAELAAKSFCVDGVHKTFTITPHTNVQLWTDIGRSKKVYDQDIFFVGNPKTYELKRIVVRMHKPKDILEDGDEDDGVSDDAGGDGKDKVRVDRVRLEADVRKRFSLFRGIKHVHTKAEWKALTLNERAQAMETFAYNAIYSISAVALPRNTPLLVAGMFIDPKPEEKKKEDGDEKKDEEEDEDDELPDLVDEQDATKPVVLTTEGMTKLFQVLSVTALTEIAFDFDKGKFDVTSSEEKRKPEDKERNVKVNINLKTLPKRIAALGLAGMGDQIQRIIRDVLVSKTRLMSEAMRKVVKPSRGALLYGPPGTGKTALARGLAKVLGCKDEHVQLVNATEVFGKYVGESEGNVRKWFAPSKAAFRVLGEKSPIYVLIVDEIDAMLPVRGSSGGNGWRDTVVNQFLCEMDGLEQCDNLIVIGMTNRIDQMDPACLRPGRFGCKVEVGYPKEEQRVAIFRAYYERLLKSDTDEEERLAKIAKDKAASAAKEDAIVAEFKSVLGGTTCPALIASLRVEMEKSLQKLEGHGQSTATSERVRMAVNAMLDRSSGVPGSAIADEAKAKAEAEANKEPVHVKLFVDELVANAGDVVTKLGEISEGFSGADIEAVFCRAVNAHLTSRLAMETSEDDDAAAKDAAAKATVQQIDLALLMRLTNDIAAENARVRQSSKASAPINLSQADFELLFAAPEGKGKGKGGKR
jgi:SpoVK/Ycf46/Vps4 family AAA+-type ATPase